MKSIKKYLAAACVIALSSALFAGCSSQQAPSGTSEPEGASSAVATSAEVQAAPVEGQASADELIAELEAIPGIKNLESATFDMKGNTTIDFAEIASAMAESEIDTSTAAAMGTMEVPIDMTVKAGNMQENPTMYISAKTMGVPFEMYVTGDNAVLVMDGEAYAGTLADFGMPQYNSVESVLASNGATEFGAYKDAVESITKETVGDVSVYTVVVDSAKLIGDEAMSYLAGLGVTGDASKIFLTYTIDADGMLCAATSEIAGPGFTMTSEAAMYDFNKTVVPEAPETTLTAADYQAKIEGAIESAVESAVEGGAEAA